MNTLKAFIEQHPKSVALLFSELGINQEPNETNLVIAFGKHQDAMVMRLAELASDENSNFKSDGSGWQKLKGLFSNAVPAVLNLISKGQSNKQNEIELQKKAAEEAKKKEELDKKTSNTIMYVGIGVVLLIIVLLIALSSGNNTKTAVA